MLPLAIDLPQTAHFRATSRFRGKGPGLALADQRSAYVRGSSLVKDIRTTSPWTTQEAHRPIADLVRSDWAENAYQPIVEALVADLME